MCHAALRVSFVFAALLVTDLICLVIYLMRLLCKLGNLISVEDKKDRNGSQAKWGIVYILGILLMNSYILIFSDATLFSTDSVFP